MADVSQLQIPHMEKVEIKIYKEINYINKLSKSIHMKIILG